MSKSKDKILSIITNVILIAALTLLAFVGYSAFVNRNDPNNAYVLGIKPIYIKTGSMEPALLTDSIAIVKKCDISDVQKDDIIVFQKEDKLIVHRVMDKEDGYVKTKGDNNKIYDNFSVYPEEIQAKVIFSMNWIANFKHEIKTISGVIKWIVFPIVSIGVIILTIVIIKKILSMPDGATDKELSADSESNVNDSPCNKPQAIDQNNVLSADLLDIPQTKTFSDGDDIEDDFDISEDDFFNSSSEDEPGEIMPDEDVKTVMAISNDVPDRLPKKVTPKKHYKEDDEQVDIATNKSSLEDWRCK